MKSSILLLLWFNVRVPSETENEVIREVMSSWFRLSPKGADTVNVSVTSPHGPGAYVPLQLVKAFPVYV